MAIPSLRAIVPCNRSDLARMPGEEGDAVVRAERPVFLRKILYRPPRQLSNRSATFPQVAQRTQPQMLVEKTQTIGLRALRPGPELAYCLSYERDQPRPAAMDRARR